jgi:hypothetical protein
LYLFYGLSTREPCNGSASGVVRLKNRLMRRIILIATFCVLALASCTKEHDQVRVRFINSTGKLLVGVTVNSLPIGDIPENATSDYHNINGFGQDTGFPDAQFQANVDGKTIGSTSQFFWCGTEKSRLEPGDYTVNVKLVNGSASQYFSLTFE